MRCRVFLGAVIGAGFVAAGLPVLASSSWQVSSTSQIALLGSVRKLTAQSIPTGPATPPKNWKTLGNLALPRVSLAFGEYIDLLQADVAQGVVTASTGQVTLDLPLRLRDSTGASQTFTAFLTTGPTNGIDSDGRLICGGGSGDPSYCRGTPMNSSGGFRMVAIVNIPQGGNTLGSGAVLSLEVSGALTSPCAGTVCTALDACHLAGACDPATGLCSNPLAPNGTACSDGSGCTRSDSCQDGACVGGNPVVCVASDACHLAGVCDPATGVCSNPPAPNGTACSDGSACTRTDSCQHGACVGANPVACVARDACHLVGACDPATGLCSNPVAPNGTACSDGNACTRGDGCQAGACTAGSAVVCAAAGPCRAAGTCDPATGGCSNPPAPDGTACDDGNPCTSPDSCASGACAGIPVPPPAELGSILRLARSGDGVELAWPPSPGAVTFDVVRGSLGNLPVGSTATETCFVGLTGTAMSDQDAPPVDRGYWYLVRGRSGCGASGYGFEVAGGAASSPRETAACPSPCRAKADCPGADSDCSARECASGMCGLSHAPAGAVVSEQAPGDCLRRVCNGAGGVAEIVDDTDIPADGDPCTLDVCLSGVPSHPPALARTPCTQNGGTVCNGAGACVQCVVAADCPGMDTECRTRTCGVSAAYACGLSDAPYGTPTVSQATGDCRRSVCDGAGGVASLPDDADLPLDGNSCTRDVCTAGTPSNPPVSSGTACSYGGSSGVCDGNGACAPCGSLMQRCCASYPFCRPGVTCKSGFCR